MAFNITLSPEQCWSFLIGVVAVSLFLWRLSWCVSKSYQLVLRIEPLEAAHQELDKRVDTCEATIGKHDVRLEHLEPVKA